MRTVVITKKEHLDCMDSYALFLHPLLLKDSVVFCQWNPAAADLATAVPGLEDAVQGAERWRALILADDGKTDSKNPFDVVQYREREERAQSTVNTGETQPPSAAAAASSDASAGGDGEPAISLSASEDEEMLRRRQLRIDAYEKAAEQPLTRLLLYLSDPPISLPSRHAAEVYDREYIEYVERSKKKRELRQSVLRDEKLPCSFPCEILCISMRCYTSGPSDLESLWTPHQELDYSRFCEYNLYPAAARYLVVDMDKRERTGLSWDYLRYLTTVLLLANYEAPRDCFRPERVYAIDCQTDDSVLASLLSVYDAKLEATFKDLQKRIQSIKEKERESISDREAESLLRTPTPIPVGFDDRFDRRTLYVGSRGPGLSFDCPISEDIVWAQKKKTVRRAVTQLLKEPQKGIRRATAYLRGRNLAAAERAMTLDEYQRAEFVDYVHAEELRMVEACPPNLFDMARYDEPYDKADKRVCNEQEKRMTKKTTVGVGIVALAAFLIGFLPFVFTDLGKAGSTVYSLLFTGVALALLAVAGLGCLILLRWRLRRLWLQFDAVTKRIVQDVDRAVLQFSDYLTHVCNVMRGHSIINYLEQTVDPDIAACEILQKHKGDIACIREQLEFVRAGLSSDPALVCPTGDVESYDYDFSKPVDYAYPFPRPDLGAVSIEYLQIGHRISVPLAYVKAITLDREEIYD